MSASTWSVTDLFMVRVAGMPVESVRGLRFPESCRWADDVLAAEKDLSDRGAVLSDLLYEVINSTTDDDLRRRLVNLRRQVFTNKLPRDADAVKRLADSIGALPGAQLTEWTRDRIRLAARLVEGGAIFDRELPTVQDELRRMADNPRFRQGLLLASPSLDRYIGSYLAASSGGSAKRRRRIERSVLEYMYRMACKTSPFSTFTGLAAGEFTDETGAGLLDGRIDEDWSCYVRLNIVVLSRISELVVGDPMRRVDLPVSLVSGWQRDLDRIRYVRRTVVAGDNDQAVSFDAVKESLFFLKQRGNLERMVELFREQPRIRYGDLVERLAAESESVAAAEYDRFLSVLLRLGLLQVPNLSVDIHSENPLRAFGDQLDAVGAPWSSELAERLAGAAKLVDRCAVADVPTRRSLLDELRAELGDLQTLLGAEQPALPQTLVYEDTRASAAALRSSRERWSDTVGASLHSLDRLMPMFDATLSERSMLKGFFLARVGRGGRCDDVLKLVYEFHEEVYDQYSRVSMRQRTFDADGEYVPLYDWFGSPEIKAVDRGRREFVDRMRARWAAHDGEADMVIDDELVGAVGERLVGVEKGFRPRCHFLQYANSGGEQLAVLNRSWGGTSFQFSRFTHCFTDIDVTGWLRTLGRERQLGGAVLAELTGGFATTNLNLHGRLSDYELVCPGEVSSAAPAAQIPLADLALEHDVRTDRLMLRSKRLGREVVPAYFGYLIPMALPDVPRTLLLLSPTSNFPVDVWGGVPTGLAVDGVTKRPRVRYGNLVLSRRSWTVPVGQLPGRTPAGSEADWLLDWRRWRAAHGIPTQVFATVNAPVIEDGDHPDWVPRQKPHYVDFDSYLSLKVLEALVKDEKSELVFSEMLPAADDASVLSNEGSHVAEMVVETVSTFGNENGQVS